MVVLEDTVQEVEVDHIDLDLGLDLVADKADIPDHIAAVDRTEVHRCIHTLVQVEIGLDTAVAAGMVVDIPVADTVVVAGMVVDMVVDHTVEFRHKKEKAVHIQAMALAAVHMAAGRRKEIDPAVRILEQENILVEVAVTPSAAIQLVQNHLASRLQSSAL
jgi:hypothetical protein